MYTYPNYLIHYGVLGMKWGRRRERRAAKKVAKATRKKAYADAYAADSSRKKAARDKFESSISDRTKALKNNKEAYKSESKSINDYYNSRIDHHNKQAEKARQDINFFNGDPFMTEGYRKSLQKHTQKSKEYTDARDEALSKNTSKYLESERHIVNQYADSYNKANAIKKEAYAKSGQQLVKDLGAADQAYKDAIKRKK